MLVPYLLFINCKCFHKSRKLVKVVPYSIVVVYNLISMQQKADTNPGICIFNGCDTYKFLWMVDIAKAKLFVRIKFLRKISTGQIAGLLEINFPNNRGKPKSRIILLSFCQFRDISYTFSMQKSVKSNLRKADGICSLLAAYYLVSFA